MNITVLCPHYAPDVAPTGEVMTAIGDELVARGGRYAALAAAWARSQPVV